SAAAEPGTWDFALINLTSSTGLGQRLSATVVRVTATVLARRGTSAKWAIYLRPPSCPIRTYLPARAVYGSARAVVNAGIVSLGARRRMWTWLHSPIQPSYATAARHCT